MGYLKLPGIPFSHREYFKTSLRNRDISNLKRLILFLEIWESNLLLERISAVSPSAILRSQTALDILGDTLEDCRIALQERGGG